jgi:Raf kinase inhibitor-like YbhB/YbcL family protein
VRRVAALVVVLALVGCAHDGRALRAPAPGASAPPLATTTIARQGGTVGAQLTLSSTAFETGGQIPVEFTCDRANTSPPLSWGAVPDGTVEMAIVVIDPDADGFVHWVLAGLDPNLQALATGGAPEGATQALNGAGTAGWTGPCPPKGGGAHHYVFTLYALTAASGVTADMKGKTAIAAIAQVPGITATITGSYQRA